MGNFEEKLYQIILKNIGHCVCDGKECMVGDEVYCDVFKSTFYKKLRKLIEELEAENARLKAMCEVLAKKIVIQNRWHEAGSGSDIPNNEVEFFIEQAEQQVNGE